MASDELTMNGSLGFNSGHAHSVSDPGHLHGLAGYYPEQQLQAQLEAQRRFALGQQNAMNQFASLGLLAQQAPPPPPQYQQPNPDERLLVLLTED